jgi:hypothetical protein
MLLCGTRMSSTRCGPLLRSNPPFADSAACPDSASYAQVTFLETAMGKYVLAWLLGVPALVLVVIYLFFH